MRQIFEELKEVKVEVSAYDLVLLGYDLRATEEKLLRKKPKSRKPRTERKISADQLSGKKARVYQIVKAGNHTTKEILSSARINNIKTKTAKVYLADLTKRGLLERVKRGEYKTKGGE